MQLSTMQDIGGCRVVVSNLKNVYRLIKILVKNDLFELRNDYIKTPKEDGYRSIHLIGKFENSSGDLRSIELQVRTDIQHSWATAIEIIDLFTKQSIKSNNGKVIWKDFFKYTSEQFAILENSNYIDSPNNKIILKGYIEEFKRQNQNNKNLNFSAFSVFNTCKKLNILKKFTLFANSLKITSDQLNSSENGYILIVIEHIEKEMYSINPIYYHEDEVIKANQDYFLEERKALINTNVVALVSTNAIGGVQEAYPNYFADSKDFIKYLSIVNAGYDELNPNIFKYYDSFKYALKKIFRK